jgi:hypothetical protein
VIVRLSEKQTSFLCNDSLTPGQQKRLVDLALIEREVVHGSPEATVRKPLRHLPVQDPQVFSAQTTNCISFQITHFANNKILLSISL